MFSGIYGAYCGTKRCDSYIAGLPAFFAAILYNMCNR